MRKAKITVTFDAELEDGELLEEAIQVYRDWFSEATGDFAGNHVVTGELLEQLATGPEYVDCGCGMSNECMRRSVKQQTEDKPCQT